MRVVSSDQLPSLGAAFWLSIIYPKVVGMGCQDVEDRKCWLKQNLARLPRVSLGKFPTPLDEAPRLSELLGGPRVLIKREDLSGLAMGGNKARVLEFVLGDAKAKGHDTVITGAADQSNLCRQVAAAAAKLGMKAVLVLTGTPGRRPQGNLLLDYVFGAEVHLDASSGELTDQQRIDTVAEDLRRRGHNPYVINLMEFTAPLGAVAYVDCMLEIAGQLAERGLSANRIYVTSGSGGTHAGLLLGARLIDFPTRIQGVSIMYPAEVLKRRIATIAERSSALLNVPAPEIEASLFVDDHYSGGGYGVLTNEAREAIAITARSEGILLDPLYTGKTMAALLDHARRGVISKSETVVFVHTGGTPALFVYSDWLMNIQGERDDA